MIYDKTSRSYGDGMWHCPFPPEWVERMARAAKHCRGLTAEQIAESDRQMEGGEVVPVWAQEDFLSEPQDGRGLPLSWCQREEERHSRWPTCCTATYDYDSIPELVVTDGEDDWPLRRWERPLTA